MCLGLLKALVYFQSSKELTLTVFSPLFSITFREKIFKGSYFTITEILSSFSSAFPMLRI